MSKPCDKPCPQCPFARATPKDYLDTKGDNGERFIGQSIGPFSLPCHMTREFQDFRERFIVGEENPPCVGAHIFRNNLGIAHLLPPQVVDPRAGIDFENVFGGHDELLAHHRGISLEEAREMLRSEPPLLHLINELGSPTATHKPI